MKSKRAKTIKEWAMVLLLTSTISGAMWHAVEHGNDSLIGLGFALLTPFLFYLLFIEKANKYRLASESERKLAKLKADLPLLATGISLAFAVVTQGFASEWNEGLKVLDRMEPALSTLSNIIESKQCIPRLSAKNCLEAKENLREIYQQLRHPNAEHMRKTLEKLRTNAMSMSFDDVEKAKVINASISAMEEKLPPEARSLRMLHLPLAITALVLFLMSGSTRLALSWVEWQIARSREGYPA